MLREVEDSILDLLRSDTELNQKIAAWYRGFPRTFEKYPYVVVNWVGGDVEYTGKIYVYRSRYEVIVVDLRSDPGDAEVSVMDLTWRIYNVLKANPTLNGSAKDSKPVRWDAEGITTERGSLKGGRIILEATLYP